MNSPQAPPRCGRPPHPHPLLPGPSLRFSVPAAAGSGWRRGHKGERVVPLLHSKPSVSPSSWGPFWRVSAPGPFSCRPQDASPAITAPLWSPKRAGGSSFGLGLAARPSPAHPRYLDNGVWPPPSFPGLCQTICPSRAPDWPARPTLAKLFTSSPTTHHLSTFSFLRSLQARTQLLLNKLVFGKKKQE